MNFINQIFIYKNAGEDENMVLIALSNEKLGNCPVFQATYLFYTIF